MDDRSGVATNLFFRKNSQKHLLCFHSGRFLHPNSEPVKSAAVEPRVSPPAPCANIAAPCRWDPGLRTGVPALIPVYADHRQDQMIKNQVPCPTRMRRKDHAIPRVAGVGFSCRVFMKHVLQLCVAALGHVPVNLGETQQGGVV